MTEKQRRIIEVWNEFEDADSSISTERLFAMTAQACKCDVEDVCDALHLDENSHD